MRSIGFLDHSDAAFPAPGSGRGIPAMDYVRTLIYHCADGGRHLEEIRGLKTDQGLWYTITAVQDARVHQAIRNIPATDWRRLHDQDSGFKTSREVAETVHTMADSCPSFRLVVVRELADTPDLFGPYTYWVVATNIPADGPVAAPGALSICGESHLPEPPVDTQDRPADEGSSPIATYP